MSMSEMVEEAAFLRTHAAQLAVVPERVRCQVARKVLGQVFDAGVDFALSDGVLVAARDLPQDNVYIVDHLLTFSHQRDLRHLLRTHDGLRDRLVALMKCDSSDDEILRSVWRYALAHKGEPASFYVEDEVGTAFKRGFPANLASAPLDDGYTAIWPTRDLKRHEPVLRDVYHGVDQGRKSALIAATPGKEADIPASSDEVQQPRRRQSFTDVAAVCQSVVKVHTDLDWVRREVTDERFEIVKDETADVRFVSKPCVKKQEQLVSFFAYEAVLIRKDHLCDLLKSTGLTPLTYDLDVDLAATLKKMAQQPEAFWILKPARLGRSMGHAVTREPACVIAHAHAGKYVAQRYIERPHLLTQGGRKYDLRFVVLLRSSRELYVHDVFFVRAANKTHDLTALEDAEVSLTAMHLLGAKAEHPSTPDFIKDHFPNWETTVLPRIHAAIGEVFAAARLRQPGFAACKDGRAMYGCDFMLTEDLTPLLLEVTFCPSNLATSPDMPEKYPEFANECFGCLFFADTKNVTRLPS